MTTVNKMLRMTPSERLNHIANIEALNAELLEALEGVVAYEDDTPPPGSHGEEVYAKACAAIAKARGQS